MIYAEFECILQIYRFSRKQLSEIWSSLYTETMEEDIGHILDLIDYNGGHLITDKTMSYLMDRLEFWYYRYIHTKIIDKDHIYFVFILFLFQYRARFEPRWFAALRKLDVPVLLLWGDSDAVSPLKIPMYIRDNVLPQAAVRYRTLPGVGHFLMLERPKEWSETIVDFIHSNNGWTNIKIKYSIRSIIFPNVITIS